MNKDIDFNAMTLRDYFAAKFMQQLLTCDKYVSPYVMAEDAYRFADIMLEKRLGDKK